MPGRKIAASHRFSRVLHPTLATPSSPSSYITELQMPLGKRMNESLTLLTRVL